MFNPREYLSKLKGRDYLEVKWRLVWFREDHPDWNIETTMISWDGNEALFKAVIFDNEGKKIANGHGSETKKDFQDALEKAETKAVGRALAMAGYGTQFCDADFNEGERIVDAPVELRGSKKSAQAAPRSASGRETNKNTAQAKETQQGAASGPEKGKGEKTAFYCDVCGSEIEGLATKSNQWMTPDQVAQMSEKRYGRTMCKACMEEEHRRRKEASGAAE